MNKPAKTVPVQIVMVDNFDSFTYNLVDQFRQLGAKVIVFRNDTPVSLIQQMINDYPGQSLLALSPGPGNPQSAGNCLELIATLAGKTPILGICLGHQAIVEALGGQVGHAKVVVHGKTGLVTVCQNPLAQAIFKGQLDQFPAARYHSLVASSLPGSLAQIAFCQNVRGEDVRGEDVCSEDVCGEKEVMAVAHKSLPILGLQFHPESILTPEGQQILALVMDWLLTHPCQPLLTAPSLKEAVL